MSDRDEVRDAFIARGGHDHDLASEVAESLRPRMRRARLVRRAIATSITFSMAALVGLAIASVDTGTSAPDTVQADGGQLVLDPAAETEPPGPTAGVERPTAVDEPANASEPTLLDTEDEIADPPEPEPTQQPAADPPPTEVPDTQAPEESETDSPDSADPAPTEPVAVGVDTAVELVQTSVGDISVEYTMDAIVAVEATPDPGFASDVEKMERTEVKVIFTAEDPDDKVVVEVEIHLEDGELTHDISPDDAAL